MTDQEERSVVTDTPTTTGDDPASRRTTSTSASTTTSSSPGNAEVIRRVIILVFGLIQILIGARFVLLLLDAREANALVSAILDASQLFVAPFEGILRTDALQSAGSVLDITAIVAFVAWTIVELIVIWAVGIFRRERV